MALVSTPDRRSRFILDIALEMQRSGLLSFFEQAWRTYGDLAHLQIQSAHIFLVTAPESVRHVTVTNGNNYDKLDSYRVVRELLLGDGLVSSRGALWRRQRRLMAPFFTLRGIAQFYDVIVDDARQFAARWERLAGSGQTVDMIDEMMFLTAAIILRAMFTTDVDARIRDIKDDVETMIQFVSRREMIPIRAPLWLPTAANRRYLGARDRVHQFIGDVIGRRRALPEEAWPDDLLGKLMRLRDAETGRPLPDTLIRDEAITLFFAGHETTARTLSFLWMALDQNPDVAAKLHRELDEVLDEGAPTEAQLKQLPYTLQVIKETLRLYPPAPFYARDAVAADVIGDVVVPAGARMLLFPYATHRDPQFWPDPQRFDPDRWLPEAEAQRHPFAYHPFAAGKRICIGNNFSLFESHIITALLAARFTPRLPAGYVPQFEMAGTLNVRNGLPMQITLRNTS